MDPLNLTLTRTTSRPSTDHPINHTPRPSLPPMTKDPFLLQTIPNPPSPTKSRIADIFHRRRQASRQQQQQTSQTYPHPPTSMPAPLLADDNNNNNIEMGTLPHHDDRAKKTDSTSTSMGTPKSPAYPPGAAPPLPATAPLATTTKNTNINKSAHRSAPAAPRNNKAGGLLLEGVRYSLPGGEPVGWFEMFEKTRKFEGGFVETAGGQVRCIHPSAWGEDELGEYGPGGGGEGQVVRSPGGGMKAWGRNGSVAVAGGGGGVGNAAGAGGRGDEGGAVVGNGVGGGASKQPQGGMMERADSETLGNARFGVPETLSNARFGESIVPTTSRSAALRSGLIGLDDEGEDGDDEAEGGPSRGRSNEMEIKVILDQGPEPGMMVGGGRVV